MSYRDLLAVLYKNAEAEFANFQRKLIFTKYPILGVRTPKLRELAKGFRGEEEDLLSYPNDSYEVVFIKLTAISALPYEEFIKHLGGAVSLMDNWALCDSFRPRCVVKHKREFLEILLSYSQKEEVFARRFALVGLLVYCVEEEYLPQIESTVKQIKQDEYYVSMAVAWLVAEVLVKYYERGVAMLKEGILTAKTQNRAIQKARESYRLNKAQKEQLKALKIKITER